MKKWPSLCDLSQGVEMELDKGELQRFQKAIEKYHREYLEKQARSFEGAGKVVLTR